MRSTDLTVVKNPFRFDKLTTVGRSKEVTVKSSIIVFDGDCGVPELHGPKYGAQNVRNRVNHKYETDILSVITGKRLLLDL